MIRTWRAIACQVLARGYAADAQAATGLGLHSNRPPQYQPFDLTPEQAKTRFLQWQRGNFLTPADLLAPGTYQVHAVLLPYWVFSVRGRVAYKGSVGVKAEGGVAWKDTPWKELAPRDYPWTQLSMQVYASFTYRRDFAEVIKGGLQAGQLRPLDEASARSGQVAAAALGAPEMRQSMAWEFVLRAIREQEAAAAAELLRTEHAAQEVKDVRVRLTPLSRRARLAYLPAYMIDYVYGETFNVHGERRAARFQAVVSGAEGGGVAGERHFSAHKAALAGGAVAGAALGAAAAVAPLLGTSSLALATIEGAFAVFFVGAAAALAARMLPVLLHQRAEEQRVAAEDAEFERVVSLGVGPADSGSEDQDVLRSAAEWRRWEQSDKRSWSQAKRMRWAEQLWEAQHRRRVDRLRLKQRLKQQHARQQAEEERERRREERWGRSSHHSHFRRQAVTDGPQPGRRHDYLGFYHALGLEPVGASQEDVKKAFRQAALRWHPDKQRDDHARREARERFHAIRAAYDVLRSPAKRKLYDAGELRL